MSATTIDRTDKLTSASLKLGLPVAAASVGLAFYAAYGDVHQKEEQTDAAPFVAGVVFVVALAVFGLLVPRMMRTARQADHGSGRSGVVLGGVALVSMVVFWSALPVVLGAAAVRWAVEWRSQASRDGRATRPGTIALNLGAAAIVLDLVMLVVGNTVLSGS